MEPPFGSPPAPRAPIPEHDGAAAVFAFRDRAFEVAIVDGWSSTCTARRFRRGQGSVPWAQPSSSRRRRVRGGSRNGGRPVVLLDNEGRAAGARSLALRLGGLLEVALGVIFGKLCHGPDSDPGRGAAAVPIRYYETRSGRPAGPASASCFPRKAAAIRSRV